MGGSVWFCLVFSDFSLKQYSKQLEFSLTLDFGYTVQICRTNFGIEENIEIILISIFFACWLEFHSFASKLNRFLFRLIIVELFRFRVGVMRSKSVYMLLTCTCSQVLHYKSTILVRNFH